jgi:hypothetical protein
MHVISEKPRQHIFRRSGANEIRTPVQTEAVSNLADRSFTALSTASHMKLSNRARIENAGPEAVGLAKER